MRHPIFVTLTLLPLMAAEFVAVPSLPAQEREENRRERLAPTLPAESQPLGILLAVPDSDPPVGSDLEVVRYGQAGRLSRPNALDLPERPQALNLAAWDWLRPQGRTLELAARDPYRIWLVLDDGMQGVLVSSEHLELFWGTVEWKDASDAAMERHVSAGSFLIRGRGTARITRDDRGVAVSVRTGRFEVEEDGRLIAVVGAGQDHRLAGEPMPEDRSAVAEETIRTAERLRDVRREALEILLRGEELDGNTLSLLWDRTVELGPWYSYAEELRVEGIPHPDLILRDMGEVLRMIAAFRFVPPPAAGM